MVNLRFQTITGFSFNCFVLVLFQKFHRDDDDDDEVTEAVQRASDNLGFTVKSIPNATHVTCNSNVLLIGKYVYGPFKSKRSIDCRLLTNTSWSVPSLIFSRSRFTIAITMIHGATAGAAGSIGCCCPRGGRHVIIGTAGVLLESIYKCLNNELDGQFINSLHVLRVAVP